jgi:hypothetical protein
LIKDKQEKDKQEKEKDKDKKTVVKQDAILTEEKKKVAKDSITDKDEQP